VQVILRPFCCSVASFIAVVIAFVASCMLHAKSCIVASCMLHVACVIAVVIGVLRRRDAYTDSAVVTELYNTEIANQNIIISAAKVDESLKLKISKGVLA